MSVRPQRSPEPATVAKWIGFVESAADKQRFHLMRKNIAGAMMNEIATHVLTVESEADGNVAFLLVHYLSGRALLASFEPLRKARPEAVTRAEELFAQLGRQRAPSETFERTAIALCSFEVTNEALEEHYADALMLVDRALERWPHVGELWRQSGILRLTQGDTETAVAHLTKARLLKPDMGWLDEPFAFAREASPV